MNCKHKPRYLGPYEVVRQTRNGAYIVKELNGDISRESIAAYRLLAYHPSNKDLEHLAADSIDTIEDHYQPMDQDYSAQDLGNEDIVEADDEDEVESSPAEELFDEEEDNEPVSQRTRSHT
ncbi:hypothetical protein GSI_07967 [Ganoderma sinense ZZ0214-1]|uniref:Uncharacterized protein n=1 Tax=Ganoderma sinense ZZ0214-1 TaxID=1077348 RepID=A0A2G8S7J9_9APHY|nr:hypothetical protein GSI_07967 [Ganoderma sinense ZZ0214-1]